MKSFINKVEHEFESLKKYKDEQNFKYCFVEYNNSEKTTTIYQKKI